MLNSFFPDFIGIGAMRSGTSWFSKNLDKHPQIAMSKRKELHFFDREMTSSRIPLLPSQTEAKIRYCKYFFKARLLNKVKGEFTPAYAILPREKISLIYSWMPNSKLIFVMRDPVLRAWSHARKDYEIYQGKSIKQASTDEVIKYFEQPAVASRGNYADCLENWFSYYPKENFFITFMDEVATRPLELMNEVYKFLGVGSYTGLDKRDMVEKVNARPSSDMPDGVRKYLEDTLYKQNSRLESLISRKLPW